MMEQNAEVTPEERRAALDRIAARCVEALLVVEHKARRMERSDRSTWIPRPSDVDAWQNQN